MFSVIMPYYKNRNVIERSLNSILNQTNQNFEIIIVDDGSEDEIEQYISSIHDSRIHFLSQKNAGVSVARNSGIKAASGEWICFLDSDDEWMPDHLAELKLMQDQFPNSQFLITSYLRKGNTEYYSNSLFPDDVERYWVIDDLLRLSVYKPGIIHTNSVCIKKTLLDKCGLFEPKISKGEDTDLWYRCSLFTEVIASKKTTTIYHRDGSFLTKTKSFNYNWIFLKREQELLSNEEIPISKRNSVRLFCQNYYLSSCKRLFSDGRKKEVGVIISDIEKTLCPELKKTFRQIKNLYLLPSGISKSLMRAYYKRKDLKY